MKRTIATACVLAMMACGVCAQQSPTQQPTRQKTSAGQTSAAGKKKTSSKKKTAKPVASSQQLPPQTMPPMPATLMNSAPVKPSVTMASGLLTIDAPNSTLSDVLNGVRGATGAAIEGASPTERVAVKLGPGNPEQVIAALLRGTPYDYVILGSLGRQDVVTRVLLTQQSSQSSADGGQPVQSVSQPQGSGEQRPSTEGMPDRTPPEDAAGQPENESDQAQQPEQPQAQQPQQDPNQPKTPEQLFKELQQLEQQKQPR